MEKPCVGKFETPTLYVVRMADNWPLVTVESWPEFFGCTASVHRYTDLDMPTVFRQLKAAEPSASVKGA